MITVTRRWSSWFGVVWALILAVLLFVNLGVGSLLLLPFYALLAPYYVFDIAYRRGDRRVLVTAGFWVTAGVMAVFEIWLALNTFGIG